MGFIDMEDPDARLACLSLQTEFNTITNYRDRREQNKYWKKDKFSTNEIRMCKICAYITLEKSMSDHLRKSHKHVLMSSVNNTNVQYLDTSTGYYYFSHIYVKWIDVGENDSFVYPVD